MEERVASWMREQGRPVTAQEVCEGLAVSDKELNQTVAESSGRIRSKDLGSGVTLLFLRALLAEASASGPAGKRQHLSSGGHLAAPKRARVDDRHKVLAELQRKQKMIEKHTSAGSKETRELTELTEKWAEVGQQALEDLKRLGNSDKSLRELCKSMGIDAKLLTLEEEEEEEEEKEEDE